MNHHPIKNIIFDLGGVLLDIDFTKTRNAFVQSGVVNFDDYFHQSHSNPLFTDLETGLITPEKFYENFRAETGLNISDESIKNNWNALLGSFRPASLELLASLKENYKLFLFSNTNLIHFEAFILAFEKQIGTQSFHDYFERAYYSHEMNYRKPDVKSFQFIINENNLQPAETLFVDDTLINIKGAEAAGLQTLWLSNNQLIEKVLPTILNN